MGKYLRYVTAQSTVVCKQECPRDYLQTSAMFPCPQTKELLTLNSVLAHAVQFQLSAVLEQDSLLVAPLYKHQEGLIRSKALHLVGVLFRQP